MALQNEKIPVCRRVNEAANASDRPDASDIVTTKPVRELITIVPSCNTTCPLPVVPVYGFIVGATLVVALLRTACRQLNW
jgi:hypothetical protein